MNNIDAIKEYINKKKMFVKKDAGDVEKGNAMFNQATNVGTCPTSSGIGEDIDSNIYTSGSRVSLLKAPDKVYKKDFDELYYKLRDRAENKWNYRVSTYGDKFKIEIDRAIGATPGSYGPVGGRWKTIKTIYSIDDLTESKPVGKDYDELDKTMNKILGRKDMNKTINIRKELNNRDAVSCETDFVNMYESINLSEEKKIELVKLLSENVSNSKLNEFFDTLIGTNESLNEDASKLLTNQEFVDEYKKKWD